MPKGKGYFWSGLAQGTAGLYGHNQNERLADKSQAFRAEEAGKDRAQRGSQFDAMFPKPGADTLTPDANSVAGQAEAAEQNLIKLKSAHASLSLVQPGEAAKMVPDIAAASASAQQLRKAATALAGKQIQRQGGQMPGATQVAAPKKMGLMEQYLESRKNQVR